MTTVCKRLGVQRSLTSVEHPQTDGLVERLNRTLKTALATLVDDKPDTWDDYLPFVTYAYNTSKQASTKYSPFEVLYGRKASLPLLPGLENTDPKTYDTESWFYDKKSRVKQDYKIGDLTARKNLEKLTFPKERWSGPWIIVDNNNEEGTSYKTTKQGDPQGRISTANVKHMQIWYP
ncbi:hypothetical protein A0J61_11363, partial [Choanephora cucurbitarum]